LAHLAVHDLGDEIQTDRGELVDSPASVHDVRTVGAQTRQDLGDRAYELGRVDTDDLRPRARGIRERPEHVEDRPRSQLFPDRCCVSHRRVVRGGEQEAEAELVDRTRDSLGLLLESETEGLEHVCRAAGGGDGAVAVLGDRGAGCCCDESSRGRDVDRVGAVAAGTGRVDKVVTPWPDRQDVLAHRLGAPGDLVGRLALGAQSDEEAADLRGGRLAAHDLAHHVAGLPTSKVVAVEQPLQCLLNHRPRKFRANSTPSGVRTDSGWNWTPSTGSSRWRTAITSPSAQVAETSRQSGIAVAASEWQRPASNSTGRPRKSPSPSLRTVVALPCTSSRAIP